MDTATEGPIVSGWFTTDDPLRLQGLVCGACDTRVFPPTVTTCPNPACRGDDLEAIELASTGTVWSWAVNHYQPPAPWVAADPFVPYVVVAVELDGEGLTILGQLDDADRVDELMVGTPMEVVRGHVLSDDGGARDMYAFRITDEQEDQS